jgi:predicted RNA-binding protein associated with RNAse of E/G family
MEYEKPAMRRKRIKNNKIFRKREHTVKDLIQYIKVKREWEKQEEP